MQRKGPAKKRSTRKASFFFFFREEVESVEEHEFFILLEKKSIMSSFFAAASAAFWDTSSAETPTDTTSAHINPKHATKEEVERRIDALAAALASTETAALLQKGGEPGLLPSAPGTIDRATLSRWLKAEKLDVASAASRLEKHAHWRADYVSCGMGGRKGNGEGGGREN